MMKVLMVFPYYLPGFRAGGPQRTIQSIAEAYGNNVEFYILALNHDLGSQNVYEHIEKGWNKVGNARVKYVSDSEYNMHLIVNIAKKMHMVYACSLFSKYTIEVIAAKKLKKISCDIVVAPMGVFSEGAMYEKIVKKHLFLYLFKMLGMFKNIRWSFTSNDEKIEAERYLGSVTNYVIAEDLPRKPRNVTKSDVHKDKGELKVVFLSRICRKKNLKQCLSILNTKWHGRMYFDIYGSIEDAEYWNECQNLICKLKKNVVCNYCGEVESHLVPVILSKYDVLLFPTLGENFGHVIFEALSSGCIPIISDKTIWKNIEAKKCGYVIPLKDVDGFRNALNIFLDMDATTYSKWVNNSIDYAKEYYMQSIIKSGYKQLFSIDETII